MRIPAWLKKPWLHFIVLGILLFEVQAWLYPQPKPVVGPLNDARIVRRYELIQHFRTTRSAHAFGAEDVFMGEWHPSQNTGFTFCT